MQSSSLDTNMSATRRSAFKQVQTRAPLPLNTVSTFSDRHNKPICMGTHQTLNLSIHRLLTTPAGSSYSLDKPSGRPAPGSIPAKEVQHPPVCLPRSRRHFGRFLTYLRLQSLARQRYEQQQAARSTRSNSARCPPKRYISSMHISSWTLQCREASSSNKLTPRNSLDNS